MSDYFTKLNHSFELPEVTAGDISSYYGFIIDDELKGIWYNKIIDEDQCALKQIIPEEHRNSFVLELLQANTFIPPHTDSNVKCVINFYLNTHNCVTQFYELKEGAKGFQIENQTDGMLYPREEVVETESFKAEPGDVYLLNVKKPHAVFPPTLEESFLRFAFCLGSLELNYEEVKQLLT